MNPTPQAIAAIRSEVADWTPADAAIAATLNTPSVANPAPRATVPTPFTVSQVFGLISPASVAKVTAVAFLPDVRDKIQANDVPGCLLYVSLLAGGGIITQTEGGEIMALVNATQADPSYQAEISWAVANLGRPVDASDIEAARPQS